VITGHSREIGKILLLLPSYSHYMEYIWIIIGDQARLYLDLDLDLVRQPREALVASVPPVSIEDHLLLWMVVRSQT
jgi:hypothetical protein